MPPLKQRLVRILPVVGLFLGIPLVGMLLSDEVVWGPFDFLVAAVLLTGAGLLIDFVLRKTKGKPYRIPGLVVLVVLFLLLWAELAVGLFDTPLAGN